MKFCKYMLLFLICRDSHPCHREDVASLFALCSLVITSGLGGGKIGWDMGRNALKHDVKRVMGEINERYQFFFDYLCRSNFSKQERKDYLNSLIEKVEDSFFVEQLLIDVSVAHDLLYKDKLKFEEHELETYKLLLKLKEDVGRVYAWFPFYRARKKLWLLQEWISAKA